MRINLVSFFWVCILILNCISFSVSAQDCDNDFLGTKTLYKAPVQNNIPTPAGYFPVFINHVGRHGARHLTKTVESTFAYELLFRADSAGQLSADGIKLKQMVIALQKVEKGNTKSISAEGRSELEGIAKRTFENYGDVFKGSPVLDIRITKEIRTKQSAEAFLSGLNKKLPHPISAGDHNDDTDLRFYDLSPAYKKFENEVDTNEPKISFDKKLHLEEINNAFSERIFKNSFLKKLDADEKGKFVSDIFGFATIVYSIDSEINKAGMNVKELDFKSFFTCEQLTALSILDSADEYLKKGPGVDNNGIQVRVAAPLLVDFIRSSDEFIKTGKYNAELRFAHAETIAPFAALLQIEGADKPSTDIAQIGNIWKSSEVIPLSSNIQWIFYKNIHSGEYLVKILLNEKEVHITGLSKNNPAYYYKWSDLRAFYINKLNNLNIGLTDDMNAYLINLK